MEYTKENEIESVIKRIAPIIEEIRGYIGAKNAIELFINNDGSFDVFIYAPKDNINADLPESEKYTKIYECAYIPPQNHVIKINKVN